MSALCICQGTLEPLQKELSPSGICSWRRQGTSSCFWGVTALFFPCSVSPQSKVAGKKEEKKKENWQKKSRRKVQKEKKRREEKDKWQKEKWPKDRTMPWEEMVENERKEKEKEKEKEREGQPTLAALMKERLLGSMPSDAVGVPSGAPPPRPSANQQVDRTNIFSFIGGDRWHRGATTVFFNTTVPLFALCWPANSARSWWPS